MHRLNISLRAQAYSWYHNLVRIIPPNKGERGGRERKRRKEVLTFTEFANHNKPNAFWDQLDGLQE